MVLSPENLSLAVQVLGLAYAVSLGVRRPYGSVMPICVGLGIIVDIVAQGFIAGGGPGAVAGFFMLPIYACLCGWIGQRIGRSILSRKEPRCDSPPYCRGCDYSLFGNVSGICPECGKQIDEHPK
jgi:hypothetical protein